MGEENCLVESFDMGSKRNDAKGGSNEKMVQAKSGSKFFTSLNKERF